MKSGLSELSDFLDGCAHHENSDVVAFRIGGEDKKSRAVGVVPQGRTDHDLTVYKGHLHLPALGMFPFDVFFSLSVLSIARKVPDEK